MDTLPNEVMNMVYKRLPTLESKKKLSSAIPGMMRVVTNQTQSMLQSHIPLMDEPPLNPIFSIPTELPMSPGTLSIRGCMYQLFVRERTDKGLHFVSLGDLSLPKYYFPMELFARLHKREWIRLAIVLDSKLFVLVETASNEGNLHILKEASVYRHFKRQYPGLLSIDDTITDMRSDPLLQHYINLSTGTWYMVENIAELCATNSDITLHIKQCAPWGTEMNNVVTGCYSAFISDHTPYNKPLLLSRDYLVFHLPNFEHPKEDRLLVYSCRTNQCRTIQLPFDVTSYGSVDMMWIIEGQTMKIARPGYVIQPSFNEQDPIFALDLRSSDLIFVLLSDETAHLFRGYPDQTLSFTHVNYYDDRLLLRVNAQIDADKLLVALYYGNVLLASWSATLKSYDTMIDAVLISDEGNHIIVTTMYSAHTIHIESLISKFVIPC